MAVKLELRDCVQFLTEIVRNGVQSLHNSLEHFPLAKTWRVFYSAALKRSVLFVTDTRKEKGIRWKNTREYSTLRVESYCSPMKIPPSNHSFKIKISTVFIDNLIVNMLTFFQKVLIVLHLVNLISEYFVKVSCK